MPHSRHLHPPAGITASSQPHSSPSLQPSSPSPLTPASSCSSSSSISLSQREIAVYGRAADPFNKEDWGSDFDLDASPPPLPAVTAGKREAAGADEEEDWDAEIDREEKTSGRGSLSGRSSERQSLMVQTAGSSSSRSDDDEKDSARLTPSQSPISLRLPANRGAAAEEVKEDEDWDAEIEREQQQQEAVTVVSFRPSAPRHSRPSEPPAGSASAAAVSLPLPTPTAKKRMTGSAVSFQPEDGAGGGGGGGLKAALHRLLGMEDDDDDRSSPSPSPSQSLLSILSSSSSSGAADRVNIVTYPPPSSLFSLRTEDGRREMTEKQLELWLKDCVSKHQQSRERGRKGTVRFDEKMLALPAYTQTAAAAATLSGNKSSISLLSYSSSMSSSASAPSLSSSPVSAPDAMLAVINDLLVYLNYLHHLPPPAASPSSSSSLSTVPAAAAAASAATGAEAWSLITRFFSFLSASSVSPALQSLADSPQLFSLLYGVLFVTAKFWSPSRAKSFFTFVQSGQALLPSHSALLELLEIECVAHHDGSRANKLLRILTSLYLRHSQAAAAAASSSSPSAASSASLHAAAQALTDLNFYITNCSPLTSALLSPDALWDAENPDFAWMDRAWNGEEPEAGTEGREVEAALWRLCGHPSHRIELLRAMYEQLQVGWVKARVAYVLGHYALVQSEEDPGQAAGGGGAAAAQAGQGGAGESREWQLRLAERYLMECIYIIDHIPVVTSSTPELLSLPLLPILSSLSSNALILYADTLLSLSKYPYAILCYEAAALSFLLRTGCPHHALNKRLCDICTAEDDLPRSVLYHRCLLDKAMQDGNLNMYVYLVQELSRLELMQGHSRKSELCLRQALAFLRPFTAPSPSSASSSAPSLSAGSNSRFALLPPTEFKSATLNIFLQLARLYLDSERIVSAVVVLEQMVKGELPRTKAGVVNLLLATAYLKRRRYRKCERILKLMEGGGERAGGGAGGGQAAGGKKSTLTMGGLSVAGGDILNSLDYLLIRSKCAFHSSDFTSALYWIDLSLTVCSSSSLSMLARLHYRRAKIYQAAMMASMSPPVSSSESFFPPPLSPPVLLSGLTLPDPRKAVSSFYEAYRFYDSIDDSIHMSKCIARITALYCHIAFPAIALFSHQPSALLPWLSVAEFDVSSPSTAFSSFLSQLSDLAHQTLSSSLSTLQLLPLLSSYLSLAEIRMMEGNRSSAAQWWQVAADAFCSLFVSGGYCVAVKRTSPGWVSKISSLLRRLVRLMLPMRGRWLRRRLQLLEVWLLYEMEMQLDAGREQDDSDTAAASPSSASSSADGTEAAGKTLEPSPSDKRREKSSAAQRADAASLLDVFSHHSFEPLSPSSPSPAASASQLSSALLRHRPAASHTWSEHRSLAFGALGSRSKQTAPAANATAGGGGGAAGSPTGAGAGDRSLGLGLSGLSAAALQSVSKHSDSVMSGLAELRRCRDHFSAGKLSQKELRDRNHQTLNKMRHNMAAVRALSAPSSSASASAPALSSSRARLSLLLSSARTVSDPLYPNLLYFFPLDMVYFIFSPQLSHRLLRIIPASTPAPSPTSSSAKPGLPGIFSYSSPSSTSSSASSSSASSSLVPSTSSSFAAYAAHFDRMMKEFYASAPRKAEDAAERAAGTRLQMIEEMPTGAKAEEAGREANADGSRADARAAGGSADADAEGLDDVCDACGCEWYVHHPYSAVCRNCFHHHSLTARQEEKQEASQQSDSGDDDDDDDEDNSVDDEENDDSAGDDGSASSAEKDKTVSVVSKQSGSVSMPAQYHVGGADAASRAAAPGSSAVREEDSVLSVDDVKLADASSPSAPLSTFSSFSSNSFSVSAVSASASFSSSSSPSSLRSSDLDALLPPSLELSDFTELFSSLDPQNILTLFSALFSECQIVVTSQSVHRLQAVVTALTRLMYPFAWQYLYIPVLPPQATPMLAIHLPYIIGVQSALFDTTVLSLPSPSSASSSSASAAPSLSSPFSPVVAELDRNSVRYHPGSFINFPAKVKNRLYKTLVKFQSSMFLIQASCAAAAAADGAAAGAAVAADGTEGKKARKGLGVGVASQLGLGASTTTGLMSRGVRSVSGYTGSRSEGDVAVLAPASPSQSEEAEGKAETAEVKQQRGGLDRTQSRRATVALRAMRDGFISIFLSLFSTYPLFLLPHPAASPASASSSTPLPFDLPSFLFHSKPHYSSFLNAATRTRLFRAFILLRASAYMQTHRRSLRQRLRTDPVHWRDILTHQPSTSAASQPLQQLAPPTNRSASASMPSPLSYVTSSSSSGGGLSASSSSSSSHSLSASSHYLFDELCLLKLQAKRVKLAALESVNMEEAVTLCRGGQTAHKKRFLVLSGDRLLVYGSKRLKEKKGGGELKYERRVGRRSGARVCVGSSAEGEGKLSWEVVGGMEWDGSGKERGTADGWHVKSETEESRKRWVKLLQARCMTDEMRRLWDAVV